MSKQNGDAATQEAVSNASEQEAAASEEREEVEPAAASSTEAERSTASAADQGGVPQRVIVVLDKASLETVRTKKGDYQLLNADDHRRIATQNDRNPRDYRPDILHQELMALLDSPLNKAGKLQVYIKTTANVLIEVNPKTRIPRTFKRFSALMVQLLHKLKIRSADGKDMLLRVIKNPVTRHLPAGAHIYGLSCTGELYNPHHFASALPDDAPIVFIIGAMSTGHITLNDHPYIEEMISISEYPLSGATAINRLVGGIENHWGIV